MAGPALDKARLLAEVRARIEEDHRALLQSQRATQQGATHEEARAENDKDTRALEATYLARGLAERAVALQSASRALAGLRLRAFGEDDPIALGALVGLEDEAGATRRYLLLPEAGGLRVQLEGVEVTCLSTRSPLGRALLGKCLDDELELDTPQGRRSLCVVAVS